MPPPCRETETLLERLPHPLSDADDDFLDHVAGCPACRSALAHVYREPSLAAKRLPAPKDFAEWLQSPGGELSAYQAEQLLRGQGPSLQVGPYLVLKQLGKV